MRQFRSVFVVFMASLLSVGLLPFSPASASGIDAWVTLSSSNPAVGCVIDTAVEVRSGGSPLAGADVSIILSDDGSPYVIDSATGTSNSSGIVNLSVGTSDAPYAKTWLELRVNGAYMGGRTIWLNGDRCNASPTILTLAGSVTSINTQPASVDDASGGAYLPLITYQQQRPLSCEYSAVQIATSMIGSTVTEYQMEAVTPLSANPHWGYRGDILGEWGNTTDYGLYADALVPGLNYYGYDATSFYGDTSDITTAIDQGYPVIVWLGMRGDLSHNEYMSDGTRYQVTQYMHVMVVYGYDSDGVYLSDPGSGISRYYDWGTFNWMWDVMDNMGLVVGE